MAHASFRVIVVGGGPIGLAAAHALSKANIDYIVLEARASVLEDSGASLIIFQGTLRVLSQLQLLDRLEEVSVGFSTADLKAIVDDRKYGTVSLSEVKENFGAYARIARRARVLRVLYEGFSDRQKAKIITGTKVSAIISRESEIEVHCANGVTYTGSIVIGADGVHSVAREAIHSLAPKSAGTVSYTEEQGMFISTYRALWFSAPRPASARPGSGCSSHGDSVSVQTLYDTDSAYTFLYERLEKPTRHKVYYSEEDMKALITKLGHLRTDANIPISELFAMRRCAGMTNLQEGIAKNWSQGRIVLIGDSAHKLVPNAALGFNNGIQDVVVLTNELHQILNLHPSPNIDMLSDTFQRYRSSRLSSLEKDYQYSALTIRYQTWETALYRFVDRCIMRYLPSLQRFMLNLGTTDRIRRQRILTFVPGGEPFHGKIPWEFPIEQMSTSSK